MVPKKRNPQLNHAFRGLLFSCTEKGRAAGLGDAGDDRRQLGAGLEERCVIPPKRCIEVVSPKWMGLDDGKIYWFKPYI